MAFKVHRIPRLNYGRDRREIVFLTSDDESRVNALETFNRLKEKDQRGMLDRFRTWSSGINGPSHWFHNFTDDARKNLWIFKRRKGHTRYRYLGFIVRPMPKTDPGYQLCVLVNHFQKNTEEVDPGETKFADSMRTNAEVLAAIQRNFPEKQGDKNNAPLHSRHEHIH